MRHLPLYVASHPYKHVEQAAAGAGLNIATWLCHMVRQIAVTDFPTSWQDAPWSVLSHDSRAYGNRFMLRLNARSARTLQQLVQQVGALKAQIIRQLMTQAEPEDFPKSWQMRAAEPAIPPMRQQTRPQRDRR